MTKHLLAAVAVFVATVAVAPGGAQVPQPRAATAAAPVPDARFVDQYCETCHNTRTRAGGLALDDLDVANVDGHACWIAGRPATDNVACT